MPNTAPPYIPSCPVGCRSDLAASGIILPEGPLKRCSACGQLVFQGDETQYQNSITKFDNPEGVHEWAKITKRFSNRSRRTLNRAKRILGKSLKDIRLLDVGCSSGAFIAVSKKLGMDAEGVEPMASPARAARAAGLKVSEGYLEDVKLPSDSFDVVTLFEVIEHLKNPVDLLKECRRILRPQGLMIIRTGNTDSWTVRFMRDRWDYFCPAIGHISFFNPESMKILAHRTGFSLQKIRFHSVSLYRKEDVPIVLYRVTKLIAEVLNFPSKLFGKSHEMEVYLRAEQESKAPEPGGPGFECTPEE
ncbi:MAG: class I SAM-dependent methyltransferase [Pseudomonadota bacterium]